MRKSRFRPYLTLALLLIFVLSLPLTISEKIRNSFIAALSPYWQALPAKHSAISEEVQRLELENKLLYSEIVQLRDLVEHSTLKFSPQSVTARIIYRSPSSWYSTAWINLGSADHPTIGHNSPVLVGSSVVGVIDYVGTHQSRVRLITDSGLTPSVRVMRKDGNDTWYLAKGELYGAGKPAWRNRGHLLRGIGFNYDFEDQKGPARDLRTGEPLNNKESIPTLPLLAVGDLLVTTGMDGVFPADLNVAVITKLYPLKEGDYFYEIEAEPTAGKLEELSLVFVLPPVGFNPADRPPAIGR